MFQISSKWMEICYRLHEQWKCLNIKSAVSVKIILRRYDIICFSEISWRILSNDKDIVENQTYFTSFSFLKKQYFLQVQLIQNTVWLQSQKQTGLHCIL